MGSVMQWHKIWHLGDDVDTDALAPGAYMQHGIDVIAQHCLENVLPSFAREVQSGDVIVAGRNFGIGSSREQAAAALVHLGVAAVIAPGFGGLFFRNSFNLGLLLLNCPSSDSLRSAAALGFDDDQSTLVLQTGERIACEPVPGFLLDMVRSGGLMATLKLRMADPKPVPA